METIREFLCKFWYGFPIIRSHHSYIYVVVAALYFVGGIRATFSIGLGTGGPVAYWPAYLICMIFVFITAAVLAEICSALPAAGSIYLYVPV